MGIGGSIHKTEGWEGQWQRAKRWHSRLATVRSRRRKDKSTAEDWDFVHAFFQNCFHLKDWLKNSGAVPGEELNRFINEHVEMKLCRDICNGTKHLRITQESFDADFSLTKDYVPAIYSSPRPHVNEEWLVRAGNTSVGNRSFDVFELADKCMALWGDFLSAKRLI